jgi:hypothetical protein
MSAEQDSSQRRAHLARLVLDLGEEGALKWLEEKLWIEDADEYGGDDLPVLVADELDMLTDEQVEQYIVEFEG